MVIFSGVYLPEKFVLHKGKCIIKTNLRKESMESTFFLIYHNILYLLKLTTIFLGCDGKTHVSVGKFVWKKIYSSKIPRCEFRFSAKGEICDTYNDTILIVIKCMLL